MSDDAQKRKLEQQLEEILSGTGFDGKEENHFENILTVDILETRAFKGNPDAVKRFEAMAGSELVRAIFPMFSGIYLTLYASRAAAIEAGLDEKQADALFAQGLVHVQNSIVGNLFKSVLGGGL